jgi:hypothetical protein
VVTSHQAIKARVALVDKRCPSLPCIFFHCFSTVHLADCSTCP